MSNQAGVSLEDMGEGNFPFHILEMGKKEDANKKISTKLKVLTVFAIIFFTLLTVFGSLAYYFYRAANANETSLLFQKAIVNLTEKELDLANEKIKFQDAVIKWNQELNKPLEKLKLEDFSINPIKGTPIRFISLINRTSKKFGIPGSLISAQMWTESRFVEGLIFYGKNQGKISDWKQIWNVKRKAFDIYVKYFPKYDTYEVKSDWHLYTGEISVNVAQTNLGKGAHDTIKKENAMSLPFSVNFVGDRWKYLCLLYSNKSILFISMAYNNSPAAENGQSLISVGYNEKKFLSLPVVPTKDHKEKYKTQKDLVNAKNIIQYGKNTISIARNQKLTELYEDLFGKFKNNENLKELIPEMKLLFVDQTDYHQLIGYKVDDTE